MLPLIAPRTGATSALLFTIGALVMLSGCTDETPTAAVPSITFCSRNAALPYLLRLSDLDAGLAAGGFVPDMTVDPAATDTNTYTFRRITDALAAARRIRRSGAANACRITISVAPGTYVGSTAAVTDPTREQLPLVIDAANVTLQGAYTMPLDSAGRPVGAAAAGVGSTIVSSPALVSKVIVGALMPLQQPLIIVNAENGEGGNGAVVQGFVLRSGHAESETAIGGNGVLVMRARAVVISQNSFEGRFSERIDLREGSAVVERNFSSGPGGTCDICVAGPGQFAVRSNKVLQGGIPGVLVVPSILLPVPDGVAQTVLQAEATVQVEIINNEVSGHQRVPVGVGLRVATVGIGAPNVVGHSLVTMAYNWVHDNRFGVIVEAGFPVAGTVLRGDIDLTTSGNRVARSCQADLLVSLSRHTVGLGLSSLPYLRNSQYWLNFGDDIRWAEAWYAHPDGNGNTLTVDGATVAPGRNVAYDATRTCT